MSTSAAQRAHAARATISASLRSPFVCGCVAGRVQGVTAAQALSVIVGAGEGGAAVQAHNVVRQASSSPLANGFVLIDEFPELRLIRGERRVDGAACAVELRALLVFFAGIREQAADDRVTRAYGLFRLVGGILRRGESSMQGAHILRARDRRDERREGQPETKTRHVHAAAFAPA